MKRYLVADGITFKALTANEIYEKHGKSSCAPQGVATNWKQEGRAVCQLNKRTGEYLRFKDFETEEEAEDWLVWAAQEDNDNLIVCHFITTAIELVRQHVLDETQETIAEALESLQKASWEIEKNR